jgi:hypothetical protein
MAAVRSQLCRLHAIVEITTDEEVKQRLQKYISGAAYKVRYGVVRG